MLLGAKYSRVKWNLPAAMMIALVNPHPLGVYLLDNETSRSFQLLNLPLERDVSSLDEANNTEATRAAAESDWHKSVDLPHTEEDGLKDHILQMMSKREEM